MGRYVLKRILLMIPVIIGVSFAIFVAMNLAAGDYVDTLDTTEMSQEQVEALRENLGLNKSIIEQYVDYMWDFLHGDLDRTSEHPRELQAQPLPQNQTYDGQQ